MTDSEKPRRLSLDDDTEEIDIAERIDYSGKLKSPCVSRSTIGNILKGANIVPCKTQKVGRTIRNLYPLEKSKNAIASFLADKSK